ncbi:MAG: sulfatase [Rikenellaceae bacterium]
MRHETKLLTTLGCLAISSAALASQRPNILFCIADDATFHHFGKAGCGWTSTPNFDRVATEGLFFDGCYTPNAKSAPSRATILTGRYSWQLAEAGNHNINFPADTKVFTEVLTEQGYDVAYTGKSWAPGFPGMVNGELRQLTGKPYQKHKLKAPTPKIAPTDYAANFSDFLDDNDGKRPWFFWFGSMEPHRAYTYGSGVELGKKSIDMIDEVPPFWNDNEAVRNDMLDYSFEIEYFDQQIGKLLSELESRGELDNTIIIITSDNGMPFPRCKANNYEYSTHMPLAIMWGKGLKGAGRTIEEYVSFIDFAPTILEAAGVEAEGMKPITGRSLMPIIKNKAGKEESTAREAIYFGRERDDYGRPANQGYPIRAVMRGDIIYIHNIKPYLFPAGNPETGYLDVDGSPTKTDILTEHRTGAGSELWQLSMGIRPEVELYDLSKDKYCVNNLANDPAYSDIKTELAELLLNRRTETHDPRLGVDGDHFDRYNFIAPNCWNFYERVVTGEIAEPWNQTGWVTPTDYESHPDNFK